MIEAKNVTKAFGSFKALSNMTCTIPEGCIYGLVGSNGAGKSTFLRLITGVYKPEEGTISIDEQQVWDNPNAKKDFVYVPDELFFLPNSNMKRMASLYSSSYENFDIKRFNDLCNLFNLCPNANINTFSKGMKRQASTILALSCKTKYIFFDETFDGLDPVIRNLVKKVIYADVCDRNATVVITSHSLRELEDTCDQLALLHKGGIIFESDIQNLKTSLFKVQIAFDFDYNNSLFDDIDTLDITKKGSVSSIIVRGDKELVTNKLHAKSPILFEILPLSLEEVFIYEMEALGYAFKDVLL